MTDSASYLQYSVKTNIEGNIGILTFFNPASNSLPLAQMHQIASVIRNLGRHPEVRVILIKSEGDSVFCSGASFDELLQLRNHHESTQFFMGFAQIILAIKEVPQPVVVRIHGKTVGGGLGLVAAGDFSFSITSAEFRLSELSIGLGPFVIGPAVKRKIGLSAFTAMTLQPDKWFSAQWMYEKGMITSLHPNKEDMDNSIIEFTSQLAGKPDSAVSNLKNILWQETEHWKDLMHERAIITGELALSHYTQEKLRQFKNNKKKI